MKNVSQVGCDNSTSSRPSTSPAISSEPSRLTSNAPSSVPSSHPSPYEYLTDAPTSYFFYDNDNVPPMNPGKAFEPSISPSISSSSFNTSPSYHPSSNGYLTDEPTSFFFSYDEVSHQLNEEYRCPDVTTSPHFDFSLYASSSWYIHQMIPRSYLKMDQTNCAKVEYCLSSSPLSFWSSMISYESKDSHGI